MKLPLRSCALIQSPAYAPTCVPKHINNPCVRALGAVPDRDETLIKLARYPEYGPHSRTLSASDRQQSTVSLFDIVVPIRPNELFAETFGLLIRQGYAGRNPLDLDFQRRTKRMSEIVEKASIAAAYGELTGVPIGALVSGISGLGKTSMVGTTLDLVPNGTIVHSHFQGVDFHCVQVPILVVSTPSDASTKGLVTELLNELGRLTDTNIYEGLKNRDTKTGLIPHLIKQMINYSVGMVVIDEAGQVTAKASGGHDALLFFWIHLMNQSGIPLVLIANPEFDEIMNTWLKAGLRFAAQGYTKMKLLPRPEWEVLMFGAWDFQWTKTETPLSNALMSKMWDYSRGNPKITLIVYQYTQRIAIRKGGVEKITLALIDEAYQECLGEIEPILKQMGLGPSHHDIGPKDLGTSRHHKTEPVTSSIQAGTPGVPSHAPPKPDAPKIPKPPNKGKLPATGLLSLFDPKVRGDRSIIGAARELSYVRNAMEFWN